MPMSATGIPVKWAQKLSKSKAQKACYRYYR